MYSTMKKRNGDSCFVYPQLSHHIIIKLLTARFPSTHADKSYSFSRHLKSHSQGFQRQTAEKKGKRQKKTDGREEIKAFRVLCKFLIDQRVIHCLIVPRKNGHFLFSYVWPKIICYAITSVAWALHSSATNCLKLSWFPWSSAMFLTPLFWKRLVRDRTLPLILHGAFSMALSLWHCPRFARGARSPRAKYT